MKKDEVMSETRWTTGPWFVATGCSWRRILQESTDEPVIVPTKSRADGHPDLIAKAADLQLAATAWELYQSHESLIDAIRALLAGKPVYDMDERLLRATRVRAKTRGQNDETECSQ